MNRGSTLSPFQIPAGYLAHYGLQRKSDPGVGGDTGAHTHAAAAHGISGTAQSLPHGDAIQRSFGDHEVSGITAHVGGRATEASISMGALAYASGNSVAFAQSPDLHTAAHEAAHVVQQRGGVQLKGGVGESGDQYERHADAVADRVVGGESAQDLLSGMHGGAGRGGASVQHAVQRQDAGTTPGAGQALTPGTASAGAAAATAAPASTATLSGAAWVAKFPASTSLDTLNDPFKTNTKDFVAAVKAGGAAVRISTTYRPDERAFLMHWSYKVAKGTVAASAVPAKAGIDINWVHPTEAASKAAAQAMIDGYDIVYAPAYPSNHSGKTAVDMYITWSGEITVKNKDGTDAKLKAPGDNSNTALHAVGATYGVMKLVSDPPHWSANGR